MKLNCFGIFRKIPAAALFHLKVKTLKAVAQKSISALKHLPPKI